MRMGSSQFFVDHLQDFELKVAQCGGMSDSSKIMHLDTGINAKLRLLLLSKSLPDDNYLKWVNKVKAVAGRLENTQSYRTAGGIGKNTWYVPQNGAATFMSNGTKSNHQPILDADGDTRIGGIDSIQALQAAINANGEKKTKR